jgi:YHS domain-containing protein
MRKLAPTLVTLVISCIIAVSGIAQTESKSTETKAVTNKNCPVMGSPVSEKARAEHNGQFVYFCCEGCNATFGKDPDKYISTLSKEDQEAIKPNTECPVTKEAVNKTLFLEHKGRKVYFCCEHCVDQFKKDQEPKKGN